MKPIIKTKEIKRQKEERKSNIKLIFLFAIATFLVILISLGISSIVTYLVLGVGLFRDVIPQNGGKIIILMFIVCLVLGFGFSMAFGPFFMSPFNKIINVIKRLSGGDFKQRIDVQGKKYKIGIANDLVESINTLASELDRTEMLRSDFVNNFSHEFKTPIVSIAGFANLLKDDTLSKEQRDEYLNIIIEESQRLVSMSTKVLDLTRIENQSILSDVKEYNLSEQLRNCILLLEKKWSEKNLDIQLDFDEFKIQGNETMLSEVWINILDNAVKFTPYGGTISVLIEKKDYEIVVSIKNTGSTIEKDHLSRIFDKFYQEDTSHSGQGNGIGLSLAKSIVKLHEGNIYAESENDITCFIVELPL